MKTKYKILTAYLIMGLVWCIINLPNLLQKAGNSTIKATGLALFRVISWPILMGNIIRIYFKKPKLTENNTDE